MSENTKGLAELAQRVQDLTQLIDSDKMKAVIAEGHDIIRPFVEALIRCVKLFVVAVV